MIYIATATLSEAKPFVEYFSLKQQKSLPFSLFKNSDITLIVTGIGYLNAPVAVAALFGQCGPKEDDLFVNIGICAATDDYAIGELLLAHKLSLLPILKNRAFDCYCDLLFEHDVREVTLTTALAVHDEEPDAVEALDMEGYFLFQAAKRFFSMERMLFLKVVSDHFASKEVTPKKVEALIAVQCEAIVTTVKCAQQMVQASKKQYRLNELQRQQLDEFAMLWKLSHAQHEQLETIAVYKGAIEQQLRLPSGVVPSSKAERNSRFNQWLESQREI